MKYLISMIAIIAILAPQIFFTFLALLGIDYEGADSSPIYIIYMSIISIVVTIIYVYTLIVKGIAREELPIYMLLFALLILHFIWVIVDPVQTKLFPEYLVFFLIFGLPGFLSLSIIIKLKLTTNAIKITELLFILSAIGIIKYSLIPTLSGVRTASLAGVSYQQLSYYSAFTFGMLLTYHNLIPTSLRFSWHKNLWYKLLIYVAIIGCAITAILGGGRGAFILLVLYLAVNILSFLKPNNSYINISTLIKRFFQVLAILITFVIVTTFIGQKEFLLSGFERATQFINFSEDGTNEASSGRDGIYRTAIDFINERFLFGYGPFGFKDKTIHAHNIFLDIFLQFGVIGFLISLLTFLFLIIKLIKNWSIVSVWILSLIAYPVVLTLFSGTYLHQAIYIFCLSYLVMYKKIDNRTLSNY